MDAGRVCQKNLDFLENTEGSVVITTGLTGIWSVCLLLAIGILTEKDDMVNYVVNYFYNGVERLYRETDPGHFHRSIG